VVTCWVGAAAFAWLPAARAHPHAFGFVGYLLMSASAGYVLGGLGGMDGPFFYIVYLLPCVVIGLPASLLTRCAFTAAIIAAFLLTFVGLNAEHIRHPFSHVAWVHLTLITCAFIYFGHALHTTSRERFLLATLSREQGALLERHNQQLEQELQVQTRDLLAVTDRAAHVRWEERTHLARALHDDLGQLLVSARIHLHSLQRALGSARQDHKVDGLRQIIEGIDASARGVVAALREDDVPFEVAVEDLVESFRSLERVSIDVALRCQEWEPAPRVRDVCQRVIQESLSNVLKHANATRVEVEVARAGNDVRIRVSDNGLGLPTDASLGGGFGLRGMRERVEECGGALTLDVPEGGAGTVVNVVLPVRGEPRQQRRAAP
jgi:signal transduction histidine kinase